MQNIVKIRGTRAEIVRSAIPGHRQLPNKHYYKMRCGATPEQPATIERHISNGDVYGTIIADAPIDTGAGDYLELTEEEESMIVNASLQEAA